MKDWDRKVDHSKANELRQQNEEDIAGIGSANFDCPRHADSTKHVRFALKCRVKLCVAKNRQSGEYQIKLAMSD